MATYQVSDLNDAYALIHAEIATEELFVQFKAPPNSEQQPPQEQHEAKIELVLKDAFIVNSSYLLPMSWWLHKPDDAGNVMCKVPREAATAILTGEEYKALCWKREMDGVV